MLMDGIVSILKFLINVDATDDELLFFYGCKLTLLDLMWNTSKSVTLLPPHSHIKASASQAAASNSIDASTADLPQTSFWTCSQGQNLFKVACLTAQFPQLTPVYAGSNFLLKKG